MDAFKSVVTDLLHDYKLECKQEDEEEMALMKEEKVVVPLVKDDPVKVECPVAGCETPGSKSNPSQVLTLTGSAEGKKKVQIPKGIS